MIKDSGKQNSIILTIAILFFLLICSPYVCVATYANPSADDFSNLLATFNRPESTFLGKAISQSAFIYLTWQGTFFGNLLTYIGGAIYYWWGVIGLQIEYICNILLFFGALWGISFSFYSKAFFSKKQLYSATFTTAGLIGFMSVYNFDVSELFYWHTGLSMYTVPLSLAIIVVVILLNEENNHWQIIIAALLAFASSGGALDISAFVCGVTFLIAIYKSFCKKKVDRSVMVFLLGLLGAVINVAAPGNYVRHSAISAEYPILTSLKHSNMGVFKELWKYSENGTIIFVILLCIVMFNSLKKSKITFVNPVLLAIVLYIGSVIIDFPVYLGYAGEELPIRCEFVRRVAMTLFLFAVSFNTTGWFAKRSERELCLSKELLAVMCLIFFTALHACVPTDSWEELKPFKIYSDLYYNHRLSNYEKANQQIIETLKNSKGQDVVLKVPGYNSLGYLKQLGLSEDPDNWINVDIAKYFGNNSIVFTVGE